MDLKNVYYKIVVAPLDMLGERKSNLTIAPLPGKHQIPGVFDPRIQSIRNFFSLVWLFSRKYIKCA